MFEIRLVILFIVNQYVTEIVIDKTRLQMPSIPVDPQSLLIMYTSMCLRHT